MSSFALHDTKLNFLRCRCNGQTKHPVYVGISDHPIASEPHPISTPNLTPFHPQQHTPFTTSDFGWGWGAASDHFTQTSRRDWPVVWRREKSSHFFILDTTTLYFSRMQHCERFPVQSEERMNISIVDLTLHLN